MARGKFSYKKITLNDKQLALIRNYSAKGLEELTGIPESQCRFIRSNKPTDYRLSTIKTLAEGFKMSVAEFLNLN